MKCSFLEIYNENVTDLLRPSSGNLNLREDMKRGCYVDNLSEEIVLNGMLSRGQKKKNFASFGQPTRVITCAKYGNDVISA